jgi:hypothetical protein
VQLVPFPCQLSLELFAGHLMSDQPGEAKQDLVGHAEWVLGCIRVVCGPENFNPYLLSSGCHHSQKSIPEIVWAMKSAASAGWKH